MMQMPAPSFQPQIRVRAGRVARELAVEVETLDKGDPRLKPARKEDAKSLLTSVAGLVAAGGWAMPGESSSGTVLGAPSPGPNREAFVVKLSATTPDVVSTMARTFAFLDVVGTRRVVALRIAEGVLPDEVVATTVDLASHGTTSLPFRAKRAPKGELEAKALSIHIQLTRPDDDPALDALRALFDAWGEALQLGAFPGTDIFPSSVGFVESVEPGLAHEVIVEIEHFLGNDATWAPIYRGLARIHADVCPIVEVRFS